MSALHSCGIGNHNWGTNGMIRPSSLGSCYTLVGAEEGKGDEERKQKGEEDKESGETVYLDIFNRILYSFSYSVSNLKIYQ